LPIPKQLLGLFYPKPYIGKQDSITPGLYSTPAPTNPAKDTCFNYSKPGHFAKDCPNPYSIPRINKIKQEEDYETLGNNKETKEDKTDSEN
jgi:hypothetical protein